MRALGVVLIFLALAGCVEDAPTDTAPPPTLPDLQAYAACPARDGRVIPCEPGDDSPYLVDVRSQVPPGWFCLTHADKRLETDLFGNAEYPFPDWYLYYGPVVEDGTASGKMGVGIVYDAHGDTDAVAGTIVINTENDPRVFIWEGPSAGFVQLPTPIQNKEVRIWGLIHPQGSTQGMFVSEFDRAPPGVSWASDPPVDHRLFWSVGDLDASDGYSTVGGQGPYKQWDLVDNVDVAGQTLHLPVERNHTIALGQSNGSGSAHWGYGRADPFVVSLVADGLNVSATLQPYVEFYAEFHDVTDPVSLAGAHHFCKCWDPTIQGMVADPQGAVQCLTRITGIQEGPLGRHVKLD